ncbi:MAG: ABC transporter permease [Bacteroidales bacterium]|jgi:ABC-2 type transport system permease protein|nr:ABC transporter permease [Bacteroidales bacterium]MCK9498528.1 ABC transporter permease [Bacteroidales bacterium]MDY0314272.1 ABC transporter permease [Bacteroidales bacterium]NLB86421.1 ABC transporter permease [Bacteroidales bacterium]
MNRFTGFLKKEFLHIFRDLRTMMILFLIPVLLVLIFGFVIKNEIKDAKIAILDLSRDNASKSISSRLSASEDIIVTEYLSSYSQIEEQFQKNLVKAIVIFENNFAENLVRENKANVQIILDASDPNTASLLNSYVSVIINNFISEKFSLNKTIPLEIEPRMWFNEEQSSSYMYVPGTMALILMVITALMSSVSIVREKEMGTMEILLISPLKPYQIVLGKLAPYAVLSVINAVSIILVGYFIFNIPILGSWFTLILVNFIFITMALSLGLLISTLTNRQETAMFISVFVLLLPTMLLSGFIFPLENMPNFLQYLSYIVPAKYYLNAIKSIMLKGQGILYSWKEISVLIGMTILLIGLSIKKFKIRLE